MSLEGRITALAQAIGADIKALQSQSPAGGGTPPPLYGVFPGPVTPQTGAVRYYPAAAITYTKLAAWLSNNAATAVTAAVRKNGVVAATIQIPAGQQFVAPTAVSIVLTTADYLTMDVVAGAGANLTLRLDV